MVVRAMRRSQMYSAISRRMGRFYCSESNKPCQPEDKIGRNLKSSEEINVEPVAVERAKTRSVLAVSGPDAITFLNNLTTNELSQLQTDAACVHTFFLNARGRIIHDALIYKPDDDDTLFLECDISSLQALQTHLIMYRAKTNVEIRSVEREVGVWTVFDPMDIEAKESKGHSSFVEELDLGSNVLLCKDPRMPSLGVRILAPKELDVLQTLKTAGVRVVDMPPSSYRIHRFRLGVAEGHSEIGYGRNFPAEINGDYTNAMSSTKTNYVGCSAGGTDYEIENRVMPLKFGSDASRIIVNMPITDRKGKKRTPVGYLRGVEGSFGLGLMHLQSVLNDRFCAVGKVAAECLKPPWWKEELSSSNRLSTLRQ